jgi:hypothetical protein
MSQITEDSTGLWELPATKGAPDVGELIAVLSNLISEDYTFGSYDEVCW